MTTGLRAFIMDHHSVTISTYAQSELTGPRKVFRNHRQASEHGKKFYKYLR